MHKRGRIYLRKEPSFHVDGKWKNLWVRAKLWDQSEPGGASTKASPLYKGIMGTFASGGLDFSLAA